MGDYLLQIRRAMPMSAKYLCLKVKDIRYSVVQYSDPGIWTPLFQTEVVLTVPLQTSHDKQ